VKRRTTNRCEDMKNGIAGVHGGEYLKTHDAIMSPVSLNRASREII
jgi:hypothetical protein